MRFMVPLLFLVLAALVAAPATASADGEGNGFYIEYRDGAITIVEGGGKVLRQCDPGQRVVAYRFTCLHALAPRQICNSIMFTPVCETQPAKVSSAN